MYKLFIDESGKNTLKLANDPLPHFLIGGAIVNDQESEFLRRRGDQIKFKYWGHTKVTFRGTNMRGLSGDFAIFRNDPKLQADFYADFKRYVESATFKFICITVNKNDWIAHDPLLKNAVSKGWLITPFEKSLTRSIFEEIVKTYLCHLKGKKNSPGQIIVEASDITQDGDILAIYNQFMFGGLPAMGLSTSQVRDLLTCISFATKNNRDPETQIADLGTHFLAIKARSDDGLYAKGLSLFERDIISAFESKSFVDACNALQPRSIRRL